MLIIQTTTKENKIMYGPIQIVTQRVENIVQQFILTNALTHYWQVHKIMEISVKKSLNKLWLNYRSKTTTTSTRITVSIVRTEVDDEVILFHRRKCK